MSRHRYAAKIDNTQPGIVKDLEAIGIEVWDIRYPVDLLLRFWCNRHHDYCWQPLEIKTPYGVRNPKARVDRRQTAQNEFLRETNTPTATSFDEALAEINRRHQLLRITVPRPL